jgi:hypothetical protein
MNSASSRDMRVPVIALFLSVPLFSTLAFADQVKVPANNPCTGDIQKYCSDKVPGTGELAKCMKAHASELSSGCKSFGEEFKKKHPEVVKKAEAKAKKKS